MTEKEFFKKMAPPPPVGTHDYARCSSCPCGECPISYKCPIHSQYGTFRKINNHIAKHEKEFKETQDKLKFLESL